MRKIFLIILLLFWFSPIHGEVFRLDPTRLSVVDLTGRLEYLDPGQKLEYEELAKIDPSHWKVLNRPSAGFIQNPIWLRFTFLPVQDGEILLSIINALFPRIELHVINQEGTRVYHAGLLEENQESEFSFFGYPSFSFETKKDQEYSVFIRIESQVPARVPIYLFSRTGFLQSVSWKWVADALFYSILFTLITANFLFWVQAKRKIHLYLSLNFLFFGLFQSHLDGYFLPIPFLSKYFSAKLASSTVYLSNLYISKFFIEFTKNKNGLSTWIRIHRWIQHGLFFMIFVTFIDLGVSSRIGYGTFPFIQFFFIYSFFIAWKNNNNYLLFFIAGYTLTIVPVMIYTIQQMGLTTEYTNAYFLKLFLIPYAFLLTMILLDRITISQEVYNRTLQDAVESRTHELLKMVERLEDVSRVKDHVIRMVSHDIRSPLSAVLTNLPFLKSKSIASSEDRDKLIGQMEETVLNVLNLSNGLLNEKRTREGKPLLEPEWLSLKDIADTVIHNFAGPAKLKQLEIKNRIPENLTILADRIFFTQALENIFSNSVKYCRRSDIIEFYTLQNENFHLCLHDTGTGMETEVRDQLFNPSIFVSRPGTENETGKGFGLMIVKDTIEKHGGKVEVESALNHGSTFSFIFPNKYIRSDSEQNSDKTILLVDDDPFMRRLLRRYLEPLPFIVLEAGDGNQAKRIENLVNPDLIITDILMPEMSGDDFLEKLYHADPTKKRFLWIITAERSMSESWTAKMRELGVSEIWIKPIDRKKFKDKVSQIFEMETEPGN